MLTKGRSVDSLTPQDLAISRVWEFGEPCEPDESNLFAVPTTPVTSLEGRLVGAEVELANGKQVWALIGNVDVGSARKTRHFLNISIWGPAGWFHLARYHDVDHDSRGPGALAKVLGLSVSDVFPIRFDVSRWVAGDRDSTAGAILIEPIERLSRDEWIRLAVP